MNYTQFLEPNAAHEEVSLDFQSLGSFPGSARFQPIVCSEGQGGLNSIVKQDNSLLIRVDTVDEAVLQPHKKQSRILQILIPLVTLKMLLNVLINPNFFKDAFKSETVIASKGHYPDAVLESRHVIPGGSQTTLQLLLEGINYHILADYQLVVRMQGPVGELVDDWQDYPNFVLSIDLEDKDITIVIFIDDAEITVAVAGAPEHAVTLYLWEVVEYRFHLDSFLLMIGLIGQTWRVSHLLYTNSNLAKSCQTPTQNHP